MFTAILFLTLLRLLSAAPLVQDDRNKDVPRNLLEEQSNHFEGDMVLTKEQEEAIMGSNLNRNGLRSLASRWPNRIVVYYIVEKDFEKKHVELIKRAMSDIASKTCLKFVPRKSEKEHSVTIQGSSSGCYSNIGFTGSGRSQVLNLSRGCMRFGTVVHEMLHTIGFYHMQSTFDRDDYVKILWENIKPGQEHNFNKYTKNTIDDFGVKYDYGSIMHYGDRSFSKNGEKTMVTLKANVKIGQRDGLSNSDVLKLNKMYCSSKKVDKPLSFSELLDSWKDQLQNFTMPAENVIQTNG